MEQISLIVSGVFIAAAGYFGYLWVRKGWAWGVGRLKAWWNAGKADIEALKDNFTSLESRVKSLEAQSEKASPSTDLHNLGDNLAAAVRAEASNLVGATQVQIPPASPQLPQHLVPSLVDGVQQSPGG